MKRNMALAVVLACLLGLTGCARSMAEAAKTAEEAAPKVISADMLGQGLYDILQDEWEAYEALEGEWRLLSSAIPGTCQKVFDTWEERTEFVGVDILNPLENHSEIEQGTYVGMPVGVMDAPRFQVSWYGTREGHIEWVSVQSGYRTDMFRIMVDAKLYGDPPEGKSPDSGWSTELERLSYLEQAAESDPVIREDDGEKFVAANGYTAIGHVLYSVRVVGETDAQSEVRAKVEEILSWF